MNKRLKNKEAAVLTMRALNQMSLPSNQKFQIRDEVDSKFNSSRKYSTKDMQYKIF
jgi:hypothetical protein